MSASTSRRTPAATPTLPEGWTTGGSGTKPCECAMLGTGCTATTTRTFAPGHDAKAKSLLLKAHRDGKPVQVTIDGKTIEAPAREVAGRWGFAHMITDAKVSAPKVEAAA